MATPRSPPGVKAGDGAPIEDPHATIGAGVKRFSCGDVVPGCAAVWLAPTDDAILALVASHATEAHGLDVLPFELVDQVRSRITVSV
jgi:predicted small metal-binding protein